MLAAPDSDFPARPLRPAPPLRRLVAAAVASALVMLACTITHVGATPHTLATAPASQLTLFVRIFNEYEHTSGNPPSDQIELYLTLKDAEGPLIFSQGQSFACGGVGWSSQSAPTVTVPYQPPGAAYTCVYTDERGQRTTVTIPVPLGIWQITSPVHDAQVPVSGTTGALTVAYLYPSLPAGATSQATVIAACYATYPNCRADAQQEPASGQITVPLVSSGTPHAGTEFAGLGWIELNTLISQNLSGTDFSSVQVQYGDSTMIYVTWT